MDHAQPTISEADVRLLGSLLAAALLLFALYGAVALLSSHTFSRSVPTAAAATSHAVANTRTASQIPALGQDLSGASAPEASNDHIEGYALQPDQSLE